MRKPITLRTGDPTCDLVQAIVNQAHQDAKHGNRDAAQFLVHREGAEIYFRALGIGVTPSMRNRLAEMARVG